MGVLDIVPNAFRSNGKMLSDFLPHVGEGGKSVVNPANDRAEEFKKKGLYNATTVARPIGGIDIKPNTYATVQVIDSNGNFLKVFNKLDGVSDPLYGGTYTDKLLSGSLYHTQDPDANPFAIFGSASSPKSNHNSSSGVDEKGNPTSTSWTDWILQSVREERTEKTQLVETFGANYLYSYGQKPRVLAFSGTLMNTENFKWKAIFWENWDKYFRASKLQEKNARMYISFDETIVEGYPIAAMAQQSSESPYAIIFQFSFFVTNYISTGISSAKVKARKDLGRKAYQIKAGYDFQDMRWAKHAFFGANTISDVLHGRGLSEYVGSAVGEATRMLTGNGTISLMTSSYIDRNLRRATSLGIASAHNALWHESNQRDMEQKWKSLGATALGDLFTTVGDVAQYGIDQGGAHGAFWGNINSLLGFAGQLMQKMEDTTKEDNIGEGWGRQTGVGLSGMPLGTLFRQGYESMSFVMAQHAVGTSDGNETKGQAAVKKAEAELKEAYESSVTASTAFSTESGTQPGLEASEEGFMDAVEAAQAINAGYIE